METQPWLKSKRVEYRALLNEYPEAECRALLIELLKNTTYVSLTRYQEAFDRIRIQIEQAWMVDITKCIFVSANQDRRISSSHRALFALRSANWAGVIPEERFVTRFRDAIDGCQKDFTIVIVDDFIGSGQTIQGVIDWMSANASAAGLNANLFVVTVSACRQGLEALQASGVSAYADVIVPKSISDLVDAAHRTAAMATMVSIEDTLQSKCDEGAFRTYRLGLGQQEAVFYQDEGRTPDNVFPVFWWEQLKAGLRPTVMRRR